MTGPSAPVDARPRRVLVTGAAGRLGRATVALLAGEGVAVTGLDREPFPAGRAAPPDRMVVAEATDPAAVREAMAGADAVVHLAAIPAPSMDTAERVFGGNALGTFTVLNGAAEAGITRCVIASSISIYGLPFTPVAARPHYVPVDLDHPLQIADPYALSKRADEATAEMIARRYGITVVALRYPFLGGFGDRLPEFVVRWRERPASAAPSFWAYLEDRDAARAAWLAITRPLHGYHVFLVAAPETFMDRPTEDLLAEFLPGVARRRPLPGRTVPVDLGPAGEVLGFRAVYLYHDGV